MHVVKDVPEASPEQRLSAHYAKMVELGQRRRDLAAEHHHLLYPGTGIMLRDDLLKVQAPGGLEDQMKNLTNEAIETTAALLINIEPDQRADVIWQAAKAFYTDKLVGAYGDNFRMNVCAQFTLTAPAQNVNAGVTANAALEPDPDSARISGVVATAANDAIITNVSAGR